MFLNPTPFTNRNRRHHRQNIIQATNGDSCEISTKITVPVLKPLWFHTDTTDTEPGTPDNTIIEFVLTENRFSKKHIWEATWDDEDHIKQDPNIDGLTYITIPQKIMSALRRGVYAFSLKVSTIDKEVKETQLTGHIQIEYEPTSDLHDIPYRK
jgi:hypothetical protein